MWISTPFSFILFAIACMYSPAPLYNSPWTPIAASRKSLCSGLTWISQWVISHFSFVSTKS